MSRLEEFLSKCDDHYYSGKEPLVSDAIYDALRLKAKSRETIGSGGVLKTARSIKRVNRPNPMYSLETYRDVPTLLNTINRLCSPLVGDINTLEWVIEPKLDGVAIELVYENGQLMQILTSGDGVTGFDLTTALLPVLVTSIRSRLKTVQNIRIRGELIVPVDTFAYYNERREEQGLKPFSSSRSAAVAVALSDSPIERSDLPLVSFIPHGFDLLQEPLAFRTIKEFRRFLGVEGFYAMEDCRVVTTDQLEVLLNQTTQVYPDVSIECDGIVVKLNDLELSLKCGHTKRAPRFAMALKQSLNQAVATVTSVEFGIGRTGRVTPSIKISPTEISKRINTSINIGSIDKLRKLNLHIGDSVIVQLAGFIVPELVSVIEDLRSYDAVPIQIPTHCPACNSKLEWKGKHLYCNNHEGCPGIHKARRLHVIRNSKIGLIGKIDPMDFHSLNEEEFKRYIGKKNVDDLKEFLTRKRTHHGKTN